METELAALDILSPPFLSWFFREECPTHHLPLLAVFGRRSLAGWVLILPWTARAAIISGAAVGIAASLIYCWPRWARGETQGRRTGRRGDGRDKTKEEIDFSQSETTRSNDDQQTSKVFDSDRTGVSSPLTPRVTIIPSVTTSSSSPPPSTYKITIIPSPTTTTTTTTSSPLPPPNSGTIPSPQSPPPVDTDRPGDSQFTSDQFYPTVDGEIEGASISFLDSDDDQLEAIPLVAPPIAPPTNSNLSTMEFSLSYSASSDGKEEDEEEESDEEENEGSYSLVLQSEQDKEEVVTQTIVTTL